MMMLRPLSRSVRHATAAAAVTPAAASYASKMKEVSVRLKRREERVRARRERELLASHGGLPSFEAKLEEHGKLPLLRRAETKTVQVNIGLLCNQACHHCHVESSPLRVTENMNDAAVGRLVDLLKACDTADTLDITGGAPEMNPNFRTLVREARALGYKVIDRCNLTVLSLEGQEDTAEFLAEQGVDVVASMPCYSPDNVDSQRGDGVFDLSIEGLQKLNAVGYGMPGTGLPLTLVYNPLGGFLPPPQDTLEAAYKEKLREAFGIEFTNLITITNLPVKRFADDLRKEEKLAEYMSLLVGAFNPATVEGLMCRNTVNVSWTGDIFDCDFNQQMSIPMKGSGGDGDAPSIWNIESLNQYLDSSISTGPHCYGCTAGVGSSCGGALDK